MGAQSHGPSGATFSGTTFSWTPSFSQGGSYSVTFYVTDPIPLTDSETITITVIDVAQSDLVVPEPLSIFPTKPAEGDWMSFSGVVKNQGLDSASSPSSTRLRVDVNFDGGWDLEFATMSTGPLDAGATETETWSNVWLATAGNKVFEICADVGNAVAETDETNNCTTQSFIVQSIGGDLLVSTVNAVRDPPPSSWWTFSGDVRNSAGVNAASSHTDLRIDIDNNGSWDKFPGQMKTGPLAAGATETETWSSVSVGVIGTHRFEICADSPFSSVLESDETNNCASQTFTVAP